MTVGRFTVSLVLRKKGSRTTCVVWFVEFSSATFNKSWKEAVEYRTESNNKT